MATHIKRFSDSPCSNNCTEMSEEVEISFQCLCCKINNDKNLENLVDFDTVEELCAHLGAKYLVFVSSRSLKTIVCILFEESLLIFQFYRSKIEK